MVCFSPEVGCVTDVSSVGPSSEQTEVLYGIRNQCLKSGV